jgi:hypothetical protein
MTATFHDMKVAASEQFTKMSAHTLFSSLATKDELWETYLGSFSDEANPMYRENTVHDCNCCKQFIRAAGNVLAIIDGKLVSIWDVEVGGDYQPVADAMSALVKSRGIHSVFAHSEKEVGTDKSHELIEGESHTYHHFHQVLPRSVVITDGSIGTIKGNSMSNKAVLARSIKEITDSSIEVVLELIEQKSLYRGDEHVPTIKHLLNAKTHYNLADDKELALWLLSTKLGRAGGFRNTVIGTLLVDLSEGVELEDAVRKFEAKVAPQNYKRPTALVTQGMIKKAEDKCIELGITSSLPRRFAVTKDITINNVLFADRSAKEAMNVFGDMAKAARKVPNLDKVEEVSIEAFLDVILPKADAVEVLVDNKHTNNFVSLVAPVLADAPSILAWGNNFSWSYKGEVADSMKENVVKAGGCVEGDFRFSIQWNEKGDNNIDFDAHCIEPNGNRIFHPNKREVHPSSGMLDTDVMSPAGKIAVENIIYSNKRKMGKGKYTFKVKNYSSQTSNAGFNAEIEFGGVTHSFAYNKVLRGKEEVVVAIVNFDKESDQFSFVESLESTAASKDVWGVPTQQFQKVNMIMNSPNHWDGECQGNKHTFFILEDCLNPDKARGFFNEYLSKELTEHRKVFEVLGSKLKTEKSDDQLSGLGFCSTVRKQVVVKVTGSFNRTIKVNF